MAKMYVENLTYTDDLVGGTDPKLSTANVSVTAGITLKRGDVVDKSMALVHAADAEASVSASVAYGVVVSDVVATDTVVTIYTAGRFNREKLHVASGDTVEAHEDELRSMGIYLTSIKD